MTPIPPWPSNRAAAPMKPAADALVLDTTDLDADAAFERALALIAEKLGAPDQTN